MLGMACGQSAPVRVASEYEGSTIREVLPLEPDTVLSFVTRGSAGSTPGILVIQIRSPRKDSVELDVGGRIRRLELDEEGAKLTTGGWLLKTPLLVGARFPGETGPVEITRTGVTVSVPAGRFAGCIETVERGSGATVRTVFCPKVGIAVVEVEMLSTGQVQRELAELRSFGPRVEVGEPGLTVVPPDMPELAAPSSLEPPSN